MSRWDRGGVLGGWVGLGFGWRGKGGLGDGERGCTY